jgi:hypothetical protein
VELRFSSNFSINSNSIALANKVSFDNELTLTFLNSNEVTFSGEVHFSKKVTFPNSTKITFLGKVHNVHNIIGENLTLIYGGSESQDINTHVHNASQVILAGSGEKLVLSTTIHGSLIIQEGVILQNESWSSVAITVNGDVINNGIMNANGSISVKVSGNILNNGTIKNTEEGRMYMEIAGNITNNGIWNNYHTSISTVTGNLIQSVELRFSSNFSINSNSIALANKVSFDNELTLTFLNSNEVTFSGEVHFSKKVTFPNSTKITFLGKVHNVHNIIGENLTLIYGGSESQDINTHVHNASQVILAGSGEKLVLSTTIHGSLIIQEGVILQNESWSSVAITVNGDVINNGIMNANGSISVKVSGNILNNGTIKNTEEGRMYMEIAGNITNNGIWNNYHTSISTVTGNLIQSVELRFSSNFSINSNSIALANKVSFDNELTLTFLNSNEVTFSGEVHFSKKVTFPNSTKITFLGKVHNVHNIIGENLTLIYGGSESQDINTHVHNASQVILAGSGEKLVLSTTIHGSLIIQEGVILQNESWSSVAITVNGDVINNGIMNANGSISVKVSGNILNNGTIKNTEEGRMYMEIAGNITNNGIWNNYHTSISTVTGNLIQSVELRFSSNFSINSNSIALANKVSFDNELTLTFLNSNEVTFSGEVHFSKKVTFPNSTKITFLGKVHNVHNIIGENLTLIYGGSESQDINTHVHNASQVILAGSGEKLVLSTTIHGSLIIQEGVILQNESWSSVAITVNGDVINNGIMNANGSISVKVSGNILNNGTIKNTEEGRMYMEIAGNITNNGIWNNYRTTLTFPSGEFRMTGTPTWEEPKRASSYDITDYLNTQHHWQVSVDGGPWSEQRGINDPSLVALPTVPEVTIPEPSKPDTPKICETSKPSNAPATFNGITAELYLPQVRINTQYGNVYSINLAFQSASPTHFTFKLTDFCQFENPLTIADGENTAILNDTKGIIYIPSIDVDGISFYANLYLVKTEGWIFKKELDNLVGEEAILDNNKEVTFKTPILEVISFGQGGPLVPLIDTLSLVNEIELSSGILMINAILDKFENPLDPEGIYWKLGQMFPKFNNELISEVAVQENLDLAIWKRMGQDDYKFTLQSYYNPNDPTGYYWRYVECPTLDKKYLSPGSLFNIDNASCRQKADMHLFITSVLPKLIHLANAYNHGIDAIVDAQKFVQNTIDGVKMAYSVTSDIQDLAKINNLNKIDYAQLQDTSTNILQRQLGLTANLIFNGEDDYIARGIVNTTSQIITALRSCIPGTSNIKGCTGLAIDLGGDVISTINNFAASIALKENTEKLNSITCTLDYLSKYYSFGGSRKMLAKSVGLSQDASNFVIKDVLAKTNVCNSSNMNYTLSLIERYQEQISTLNSLNSISQKPEP